MSYGDAPQIAVMVERKIHLGNYESLSVTISLSKLPFDATDEEITIGLETADRAVETIRTTLRSKIAHIRNEPKTPIDETAFDADHSAAIELANELAARGEFDPIPDEADILSGLTIFGIKIDEPRPEWHDEPITETSVDGEPGGQMRALNSALTGIGYGGARRHGAVSAILGRLEIPITSLKQLTKADAHICLSWIDAATNEAILALGQSIIANGNNYQKALKASLAGAKS